jgi:vacuolar-type H+-ATPase subunit C/Vma6
MQRGTTANLDFLAARLHGRRGRMAEGRRLADLSRLRTIRQLASELFPGAETESAAEIQRRLVRSLADEVLGMATHLSSAGAALLYWLAARFQVENLKIVVRSILGGAEPAVRGRHLVPLPREYGFAAEALVASASLGELIRRLEHGIWGRSLAAAVRSCGAAPSAFCIEGMLDRHYFRELLARARALEGEERRLVEPLILQEIDTFHLMLVARGRFGQRLGAELLLPFHVAGAGISERCFAAMLTDPDLRTAAGRAVGRALDGLPPVPTGSSEDRVASVPAALAALAANRFLRLANRAFRRSHMGLGAVVAFVAVRRVEVANLITLTEGIRARVPEEQLRARLVPRRLAEVPHV